MSERICGALGCRDDAVYHIEHPKAGRLVVCTRHADGFQTLGVVGGELA